MDHGHQSHSPHSAGHQDAHGEHHATGLGVYLGVFGALCVLTGASFWTYADWPVPWPFHDQPAVGWAFMMAVSCTKALLVVLFFMHVKYEASWKYVLTVPPVFMSIFLVLALVPDIGLRNRTAFGGRTPASERLSNMAMPPAPPAEGDHAGHGGH